MWTGRENCKGIVKVAAFRRPISNFEVLKQLRRTSDVPVLMLTARGEEPDRIVGLELGADDYLPKTFSTHIFDRSIDVHISALRKKLGDPPKEPCFIRTVRAAGYLLINPDADYG